MADISDSLHVSSLGVTEQVKIERDVKVQEFAEGRKRADALKSIMDFKFE